MRRVATGAQRGLGQRQAQLHQVAQGLVHGERAAGQRAVGQPHAAFALAHRLAAQAVVTIGHAGGGGGVGHGVQLRDGAPRGEDGARVHVQQVGDDLGALGHRQRGPHGPRGAVMEGTHRVEQVREAAGTLLQRRAGLLVAGGTVAQLHAQTGAHQGRNHRQRALGVRRQRDDADRRQRVQRQDLAQAGQPRERRLCAQALRVDVGPLQVHAQHPGRARCALGDGRRQRTQRGLDVGQRRRHRGGQQAGGAVPRVQPRDGGDGVARVHGVGATAAVQVQVDEAGQQQRLRVVGARGGFVDRRAVDGGDAAAIDRQFAADEAARGEHMALQLHASRLISLTKPYRSLRQYDCVSSTGSPLSR